MMLAGIRSGWMKTAVAGLAWVVCPQLVGFRALALECGDRGSIESRIRDCRLKAVAEGAPAQMYFEARYVGPAGTNQLGKPEMRFSVIGADFTWTRVFTAADGAALWLDDTSHLIWMNRYPGRFLDWGNRGIAAIKCAELAVAGGRPIFWGPKRAFLGPGLGFPRLPEPSELNTAFYHGLTVVFPDIEKAYIHHSKTSWYDQSGWDFNIHWSHGAQFWSSDGPGSLEINRRSADNSPAVTRNDSQNPYISEGRDLTFTCVIKDPRR